MKELLQKKTGNKGFTLAELLVVIAILAILIAIAVPVFSGMVADANLRVNQANVRTVRSAAVAEILTHPDKTGVDPNFKYNAGLTENWGWVAIAEVNNSGDISNLQIWVAADVASYPNGIYINGMPPTPAKAESDTFYVMGPNVGIKDKFATVKPSAGTGTPANTYWVQAVIQDLDLDD